MSENHLFTSNLTRPAMNLYLVPGPLDANRPAFIFVYLALFGSKRIRYDIEAQILQNTKALLQIGKPTHAHF